MTAALPDLRPRTRFDLPPDLSAAEPPEARGLTRDGVRLLVADGAAVRHGRFRDLPRHLRAGDLLVVNTSATVAGALDGQRTGGRAVTVHLSSPLADGSWLVELRTPGGAEHRVGDGRAGERVTLPGGGRLTLRTPHETAAGGVRLWRADLTAPGGPGAVPAYVVAHGRPISYGYLRTRPALADYQTVFAREPGSAEMPSAGRPFTTGLVTELVTAGVLIAPLTLHTGVSSLEAGETPYAERFDVPATTAALVRWVRRRGGRVIAVGTTVARALETVAGPDGTVRSAAGWTDLVLGPHRPARVVDGLVTGLHAPDASHLLLLEAVAGADVVAAAYEGALAERYLWHEFGDACLLVRPGRRCGDGCEKVGKDPGRSPARLQFAP